MSDSADQATHAVFAQLGTLLLEADLSVTDVRGALESVHRATVSPETADFAVLPEMVFVSPKNARTSTISGVVSSPPLSIKQAAQAIRLVRLVRLGQVPLDGIISRVDEIRASTMRHADLSWTVGGALISVGLALVFRCPWWAVVMAILLGAVIGALSTFMNRIGPAVALIPFVAAFVSTAAVGILAMWLSLGPVPLFAVCAPVALLVPGALITNGILELTATDIVTGSARLMYGLIVLGFMLVGILAGSAVTGLRVDSRSATLVGQTHALIPLAGGWQLLPPVWLGWIGVAAVAVGVSVAFGSGTKLTLVSVVMMVCTYAILEVLSPFLGSVVATGVAGAVLFIVSRTLERMTFAVPAAISFRPAFLLLVPGTIGLVALASVGSPQDSVAPFTFLSLCIGVKVGSVVTDTRWGSVFTRRNPRSKPVSE